MDFCKSETRFSCAVELCFVAIGGVGGATIFVAAVAIGRAFVSGFGRAFIGAIVATRLSCAGAVLVSALHRFFLEILNYGDADAA